MTMQTIGWAIVHSLWQGGVIALVTAALLAAMSKSGANARYLVALVALFAMLAVPLLTVVRSPDRATPAGPSEPLAAVDADLQTPSAAPASATVPTSPGDLPDASPRPVRFSPAVQPIVDEVKPFVERSLPWLVAAWVLGLLLSSARLMGGLVRTRRITRNAGSAASHALIIRVSRLCERIGVTRAVTTLESTTIDVPLVIGAIRPVIVVPASLITGLTPFQLDMLLAHELAHVRRHDYLINLIQTIVETLLFYHPAAKWISDRVREERENCCDDIAIAVTGSDAKQYTSTLLVLEEARAHGFGLAAAATGGSLLNRAQRLISGRTSSPELGPRWIAGVITIGAALFTGNQAFASIQTSFVPATSFSTSKDSTGKKERKDLTRGAPSSVIRAPQSLSLAERWKWAEQNGGASQFWIGYLVGGDDSGRQNIYMSDVPVRLDGGSTMMTGRLNMDDDTRGLVFHGAALAPLVGLHAKHSTAMFFEVSRGITGTKVSRVHINTFFLPTYFDGKPLVWLDSATDNESIELVKSLMSRTSSRSVREDIVSALGIHQGGAVVAELTQLLQSDESSDIREEAADWLGRKKDPRVIAPLSRAARSDRSKDVRNEAIEAFGNMDAKSATDTLIAFARTLDDSDLRRDAIEALGERPDDAAFSYLVQLVNSSEYIDLRKKAAEAIADMPGQKGAATVIDLAQHHRDPEIRREFIESLAKLESTSRAFDILQRIALTDPSDDVRSEAVETIAEVHDSGSVKILADIARNSLSERLQEEAVESLGETVDHDSAVPLLMDLARNHPLPDARSKALEALASIADHDKALDILVNAARTDRDEGVRHDAMEALGDPEDPPAMKALLDLVKKASSADDRIKALEIYVEAAKSADAAALLRSVQNSDPSSDVRDKARELLSELAKN